MRIEELNLAALKYFLDAVDFKSITASSLKNHISRPAVSQAILRLEQWYGQPLLKHEKRSFELTDAGRKFYQLAKRSYANLEVDFKSQKDSEHNLRFGCSASLVDLIFPKLKSLFGQSKNPTIKVGKTSTLLDLMNNNQIGFAFLIDDDQNYKFKTKVIHRGNFELRSPNGKISNLIITTEPRPEVTSVFRYLIKNKMGATQHIEAESWTLTQKLAEMMNGMCLVPDYLPKTSLKTVKSISWKHTYETLLVSNETKMLSDLEYEIVENMKF